MGNFFKTTGLLWAGFSKDSPFSKYVWSYISFIVGIIFFVIYIIIEFFWYIVAILMFIGIIGAITTYIEKLNKERKENNNY